MHQNIKKDIELITIRCLYPYIKYCINSFVANSTLFKFYQFVADKMDADVGNYQPIYAN